MGLPGALPSGAVSSVLHVIAGSRKFDAAPRSCRGAENASASSSLEADGILEIAKLASAFTPFLAMMGESTAVLELTIMLKKISVSDDPAGFKGRRRDGLVLANWAPPMTGLPGSRLPQEQSSSKLL